MNGTRKFHNINSMPLGEQLKEVVSAFESISSPLYLGSLMQ
jgi:hypothetical protein